MYRLRPAGTDVVMLVQILRLEAFMNSFKEISHGLGLLLSYNYCSIYHLTPLVPSIIRPNNVTDLLISHTGNINLTLHYVNPGGVLIHDCLFW